MDANTRSPLTGSQILINRAFSSISDEEGKFAFRVNRYDTVVFRRLGYKTTTIFISDTLTGGDFLAGIYMYSDTVTIGEIVIVPRLRNLKSDLLYSKNVPATEIENAKFNLEVSAYQGKITTNKLGDPAANYELLRQRQRDDAYTKGQIPSDRILGLSPFMLLPAAYLLMNGIPQKPSSLQPYLSSREIDQIHKKYLEMLEDKK
jgi:hypothetical protein